LQKKSRSRVERKEEIMAEWQHLTDDVRGVWTETAGFWDEFMGEDGNDFHRQLVVPAVERLLALQPGWRLLEIACGSGSFSRRMASQGAEVVAFDLSETFIERAKVRSGDAYPKVSYHVMDAGDRDALLALGEEAFDAAVSNMALMDMPAIEPLLDALRHLLKKDGRFVFSTMHPCFNSNSPILTAEATDDGGEYRVLHSVKIRQYRTAYVYQGIGVVGQPRPQHYFHRPISELFGACFKSGFMLDGMEEPTFESGSPAKHALSWSNYPEIPPVLAARMRLVAQAR
jgi:2-polyprenyl-3-methyl-5-hydroxy-6-metoxy-1,4-benzoquinol methylase